MSIDFLTEMAQTHASPSGVLYDLNGDGMAVGILIHALSGPELEMHLRHQGVEFPHAIFMPCGQALVFEDYDHFPTGNYPCPCGKPEHFMVYYVAGDTPAPPKPVVDTSVPEEAVLPGHRISTPKLDTTARTRGGRGKVQ